MNTYTLSNLEYDQCEKYANENVPTTCYGERDGQRNIAKRRADAFMGKAGEWAEYHRRIAAGENIAPPNMAIVPAAEKTFSDTDLEEEHVKTCSERWMSWVIEKVDRLARGGSPGERLALVVQVSERIYGTYAVLPAGLAPSLLRPMRKPEYNSTKAAIYAVDVPRKYKL